jgi:hypothetical protein
VDDRHEGPSGGAHGQVGPAVAVEVGARDARAERGSRSRPPRLFLSVETVKSHLQALFERFEVPEMPQNRKRAELVRRAFERGAVTG